MKNSSTDYSPFKKLYWYYWKRMTEHFFWPWFVWALVCSSVKIFPVVNSYFKPSPTNHLFLDERNEQSPQKPTIAEIVSFNTLLSIFSYTFFPALLSHEPRDAGLLITKMKLSPWSQNSFVIVSFLCVIASYELVSVLRAKLFIPKKIFSSEYKTTGEDELLLISTTPVSRPKIFMSKLLAFLTRFWVTHLIFVIVPLGLKIAYFASFSFLDLFIFLLLNLVIIPLFEFCLITPLLYFPPKWVPASVTITLITIFKVVHKLGVSPLLIGTLSLLTLAWGSTWTYLSYREFCEKDFN